MLGHRTLNVEDYTAILKRRWWLILIPGILFAAAGLVATFFIAPKFMSQTLVLIENQKVPDEYVKSVISADLDSRLASMKEQILSRSRIQPIIEKYNLYAAGGASMDDRIDQTRKEILIKPIRSEISHAGGLPGFYISFTASDPHTAQLVCGEIVSLFVSENLRSRAASAEGTTDFLKGQLADAKRSLDDQDAKLAQFQREYVGKLPGQESPNVNMLSSLNIQLEAANQSLSRMEQDKTYEEAMLAQQIQNNPIPAGPGTQGAGIVKSLTLQQELQGLIAQEAELSSHYTADYPDVIAARRKIAEMRQQIAALPPVPAQPATQTVSPGSIPPPSRYDSSAVQQLRSQIHALDLGIEDKRREQAQIQSNIHIYQDRIQSSPLVEEQYKQLTRDYQQAQTFYDSLLAKMNQSKMATDLEKRQEGEQFKVMDEPNLPDGPTYPKRSVFLGVGLALGLALGLVIVAMLEYKDTALRTERDVYAFTRLPTLAIIAFSSEVEISREKSHTTPSGWKANLARLFSRKKPREVLSQAGD